MLGYGAGKRSHVGLGSFVEILWRRSGRTFSEGLEIEESFECAEISTLKAGFVTREEGQRG